MPAESKSPHTGSADKLDSAARPRPEGPDAPLLPTVLFVNDSYFAHRMLRAFLGAGDHDIRLAVLSRRTTGSAHRIRRIVKKASRRYVSYRGLLQIYSMTLGRNRTARHLLERNSIPTMDSADLKTEDELGQIRAAGADVAVAINFDQIFRRDLLELFPLGVINAHASRLPDDRGISPALWAFARGDEEIWTSIYRIDEGLDTGPLFDQYPTQVLATDSAFSLYSRVCDAAGARLGRQLEHLSRRETHARPQEGDGNATHSWPDREFESMLRQSQRRLIHRRDISTLLGRNG